MIEASERLQLTVRADLIVVARPPFAPEFLLDVFVVLVLAFSLGRSRLPHPQPFKAPVQSPSLCASFDRAGPVLSFTGSIEAGI